MRLIYRGTDRLWFKLLDADSTSFKVIDYAGKVNIPDCV